MDCAHRGENGAIYKAAKLIRFWLQVLLLDMGERINSLEKIILFLPAEVHTYNEKG